MTIKFLKEWGFENPACERAALQRLLDGGEAIIREGLCVKIGDVIPCLDIPGVFFLDTPGTAVSFAAALNKLRRPLHLVKEDLDADWAERVKARDNCTCVGCGIIGAKIHPAKGTKDSLTAHHWLVTKSRSGMARWATACGVTYHYTEHIYSLHENPCWVTMKPIVEHVTALEGEPAIQAAIAASKIEPTSALVRALWLERCATVTDEPQTKDTQP